MKKLFKHRIELLTLNLVVWMSSWLKKNSKEKWSIFVEKSNLRSNPHPQTPSVSAAPEAFKSIEPHSRHSKGSAVDTPNKKLSSKIFPDWTKEIETFLLNQISIHTKKAYENDLKQFFRFLSEKVNLERVENIQSEHIVFYRKAMEEGRLTGIPFQKSTINRKLAVIKSFLDWLKANRYLSENPAQFVKGFPQSQESSLKGFSDAEVFEMLQKPNRSSRSGSLHAAILSTLFHLGLRKGELINLRIGDLAEERGVKVLRVQGKGHRVRIVPLVGKVSEAISHYLFAANRNLQNHEEPLFIPSKNPRTHTLLKSLNPNAISYIVQTYAKKTGVLKRVSPHSCRATCISNALDKKASHRSVQHLAGWSTPLMIQRYDKRREDLTNSAAFLVNYAQEA